MSRRSATDYERVLAVLREAGDVDGPIAFPEPVLDAVRRLVPCDVVTYHERGGGEPAVAASGAPRARMTAAGARKVSDVLSRRRFQRIELYQYVSRRVGIEDMFRLWLDPKRRSDARLGSRRDFTERDRDVLEVPPAASRAVLQAGPRAATRDATA